MANKRPVDALQSTTPESTELLRELVAHLRQHRTQLREEWANRITEARLLTAMTTPAQMERIQQALAPLVAAHGC